MPKIYDRSKRKAYDEASCNFCFRKKGRHTAILPYAILLTWRRPELKAKHVLPFCLEWTRMTRLPWTLAELVSLAKPTTKTVASCKTERRNRICTLLLEIHRRVSVYVVVMTQSSYWSRMLYEFWTLGDVIRIVCTSVNFEAIPGWIELWQKNAYRFCLLHANNFWCEQYIPSYDFGLVCVMLLAVCLPVWVPL